MDLSTCIIVCTQTGTVINAEYAVILQQEDITSDQWEEFCNASDSEASELASQFGTKLSDLINS